MIWADTAEVPSHNESDIRILVVQVRQPGADKYVGSNIATHHCWQNEAPKAILPRNYLGNCMASLRLDMR